MAVYQSAYSWLTHRNRGQAPSHSCFVPGKSLCQPVSGVAVEQFISFVMSKAGAMGGAQ
ncbi:hypothetical protein [Pseudomonas sp. 31 R 17]|nr:hypothetical protein [Pseudomonas sp. 31 R 17]